MDGYVKVGSIDALKRFRAALWKYAETASAALGSAEVDVRRTLVWLDQEQQSYWKGQIRRRGAEVTKAKERVRQKKLYKAVDGSHAAAVEEEHALRLALRRLEQARRKLEHVLDWRRKLAREVEQYRARVQGLAVMVEADIPNAAAQLQRMIDALGAYAALAAPEGAVAGAEIAAAGRDVLAEVVASAARRGPAPTSVSLDASRALRHRTPPELIRQATPLTEPWYQWDPDGALELSHRKLVADLDTERVGLEPWHKVVLGNGCWDQQRLYLERIAATADDSGWYLAPAEATVDSYVALRVAELLDLRPDLAEVLSLAPGHLVVLGGGLIEAIFDEAGELMFGATAASEPDTGDSEVADER